MPDLDSPALTSHLCSPLTVPNSSQPGYEPVPESLSFYGGFTLIDQLTGLFLPSARHFVAALPQNIGFSTLTLSAKTLWMLSGSTGSTLWAAPAPKAPTTTTSSRAGRR